MTAGPARIRIDVLGDAPREHVLDDLSFLTYRLADVRIAPEVARPEADIVLRQEGEPSVAYDRRRLTFTRPLAAGPTQKAIVTMLTLRLEAAGLHPSPPSAVR